MMTLLVLGGFIVLTEAGAKNRFCVLCNSALFVITCSVEDYILFFLAVLVIVLT